MVSKQAVRRFAPALAVAGFAALSTAPAQPPSATDEHVAERPFAGATAAGVSLGSGAAAVAGPRGAAAAGVSDDFQDLLESRVAELREDSGLTAVAVAAVIDGELAGAAVSGERRRNSRVSVTVDDRWHLGSITKSMTATLLAVLEDDGLLSADDPLTTLLPDVEMADGWSACTLDHLLTHTAGLAANFPDEFQDVWPDTAEELVAERRRFIAGVLGEGPESACGESFEYSNVGYTIAGHIAETVAGEPYETLIQNRVFAPLALMSAGFGPPRGERPDQEPVGHAVLLLGTTRVRVPIDPFQRRADNSPLIAPAGHGAHDDRGPGALRRRAPRRRVRKRPGPPAAVELGVVAHPVPGRLRPRLGAPRARLGRRFPDLAQRQQYLLVRAADVVAGQEHDPGVRDQRWRDRDGQRRVRGAGGGS